MNRLLLCIVALSCLLTSTPSEGQLSVEILDASSSVYSYEPVYVTFEVRNEGANPVVIPADLCSVEGASLVAGHRGEDRSERAGQAGCPSGRVVWLPPGGRWLFFQNFGLGAEGEFEVQAIFRSPGQCHGRPVGPNGHRIRAVRPALRGSRPYDCWSGEARSEPIDIVVQIPASEVDIAAGKLLELDHVRWKNNWKVGLILNVKKLYQKYPASHYAYAAIWATSGSGSMLNVVILQPENPLNPWVVGAMAASDSYQDRPCAVASRWNRPATAELEERRARVFAAYPPPESVKAYLRQQKLEFAAEECTQRESEAGGRPVEHDGRGPASDG